MPNTEQDAFIKAVTSGDREAARRLLQTSPDLAEARNAHGVSALMLALYHRQQEIADLIREQRRALDVFEAAGLGEVEALGALLDSDAALARATSPDGGTPLHFACFFGHADTVGELLKHNVDLSAVAPVFGNVQPLHSAAAARSATIVKQLIDAGADVNAQQAGGYTPLHAAAMHGDLDMARLLVDAGADPTIPSDDGKTPLDMAREAGHDRIVNLLT